MRYIVGTVETKTYSAPEVCEIAGVTYRQLDYWCRVGIVTLESDMTPGSGRRRRFTECELEALLEVVAIYKSARSILRDFTNGNLWASAMEREGRHDG